MLASPAAAVVIEVLPDGSGDYPTIQDALDHAVAGDLIRLGNGVFFEHDLRLKSQVSLESASGAPAFTIVDAELEGRCIAGGSVTGAPTVTGITFRNGVASGPGGILLADHNNVRFHDCVFENGSAEIGGGVALVGNSGGHAPQFFRCRFSANQAASDGGGAWTNGIGYFVECEFTDNTAGRHGGGVYSEKYLNFGMWLRECAFHGNEAGADGGAVCSIGGKEFAFFGNFITLGEFVDNRATRGGALFLDWYDSAAGSVFFDNEATESGGAFHLVDIAVSKEFQYFSGNVIAGNRAGSHGGAVAVTGTSGLFEMETSTLAMNEAPEGAQVWSDRSGLWGSVRGSILAFGTTGAAIAGSGSVESLCSDVFGNEGGDYTGPIAGQNGTNGNISEDPLFCGPNIQDYTVGEDSPCLPPLPGGCAFFPRIGALGVGCGATSEVPENPGGAVHPRSWGEIKAGFR